MLESRIFLVYFQTQTESDGCSALDSSDTDFFLAGLDIASVEREHFSQEATPILNIPNESQSAMKDPLLVNLNEQSDILSELFDNSGDMFEVQSCGDAATAENRICDVESDHGQNSAIKASRIQSTGNELSNISCLRSDNDSLVKKTRLSERDNAGSKCTSTGQCEANILPHPVELDAQDGVRTFIDFDDKNNINGASTPKSSTATNCGHTTTGQTMPTGICGRLKRALQQNARCTTPQNIRAQQLREDRVASALTESKACDGTGPFYGLPSKVQQLFETQRGITKLYGEHSWLIFSVYKMVRH